MKRKAEYVARIADRRDLITAGEVAGFFAVSPETVRIWVKRGWFPKPKDIGPRCRRWSVRELQDWVDNGCEAVQ